MIVPEWTSWPSPALTPNRWPTLSRPFFELEPAFLWAIAGYSSFLVARVRFGVAGLGAVVATSGLGAVLAASLPGFARPRFGGSAVAASAAVVRPFAVGFLVVSVVVSLALAVVALAFAAGALPFPAGALVTPPVSALAVALRVVVAAGAPGPGSLPTASLAASSASLAACA